MAAVIEGPIEIVINMGLSIFFWIYSIYIITQKNNVDGLQIFLYFIYLIFQFTTTGFRKFMNIKTISNALKENIETKFNIKYKGKAYHTTDSDEPIEEKTYEESIPFLFKSGADCSHIDIDLKDIKHRYLDFEINYIFICADEKTYQEESEAYNNFYNETSKKDKKFEVKKDISVSKYKALYIIHHTNCIVLFLDRFFYIIFIFLSLGQIYKHILFCIIDMKKITIVKIISNYYDLTQSDSFFNIQPVVKVLGEDIKFDREKYAFKECEDLETSISNNNPLSQSLKEYNEKLKNNSENWNITPIMDNNDNKAEDKNKGNNNNENKVEMANYLETPLI